MRSPHTGGRDGFTILETLIVLALVFILGGISLIAWESYYPVFALDQAATQLQLDMELARYRAIYQRNSWQLRFNKRVSPLQTTVNQDVLNADGTTVLYSIVMSINTYCVINDDGFTGNGARIFRIASPDFDEARRSNGHLNLNELAKGPVLLGRAITFVEGPTRRCMDQVEFRPTAPMVRCTVPNPLGGTAVTDTGSVWIANQHWIPNDTSDDNRVHIRRIRVASTGMTSVTHD